MGLALNHAVLKVRDLDRSIAFYERIFGMRLITKERGMMAFLRFPDSANHHDLGLLTIGANAPDAPERSPGLFHLAWQTPRIEDLVTFARALQDANALSGASDHGATKSIYGVDPDGNEFEILWLVPREHWGDYADRAPTMPLDLEAELERWRTPA